MLLKSKTQRPKALLDVVYVWSGQILVALLVIFFWELVTRTGMVRPPILVPFSDTLLSVWSLLHAPEFYRHLVITLEEIAFAYALACSVGLILGFIIGSIIRMREVLEPIVVALYAVPIIILYPLFFLVLGLGSPSKVAFAGVYALFPIFLNTIAGFRHIDRALLVAALSMCASRWQLYIKVVFPAILPHVMAGLRIGVNSTLIGVIAGEMLASAGGVGYLIQQASNSFETGRLYGLVLIVLILATISHVGLQQVEKQLSKWEEQP